MKASKSEFMADMRNRTGLPVKELLVLSGNKDPFNQGSELDHTKAAWFAAIWEEANRKAYERGAPDRLRGLHYFVANIPDANGNRRTLWDGSVYENSKACWGYLEAAATLARQLEYIPFDAFRDAQNTWEINRKGGREVPGSVEASIYASLTLPEIKFEYNAPDLETYTSSIYPEMHPMLTELWVEKSGAALALRYLCERHAVNLRYGKGYASITQINDFIQRAHKAGKPGIILYVSDFDPAGNNMPRQAARYCEFVAKLMRERGEEPPRLFVHSVALTADQVRAYDLPPIPFENEKQRQEYEQRHGLAGKTEIDALMALHPGELEAIVEREIKALKDPSLSAKMRDYNDETIEALEEAKARAFARHTDELRALQDEIDALNTPEFQAIRAKVEAMRDDLEQRVESLRQTLHDEFWQEVQTTPMPPMPNASVAIDPSGFLFDSERDYLDQLEYYKRAK